MTCELRQVVQNTGKRRAGCWRNGSPGVATKRLAQVDGEPDRLPEQLELRDALRAPLLAGFANRLPTDSLHHGGRVSPPEPSRRTPQMISLRMLLARPSTRHEANIDRLRPSPTPSSTRPANDIAPPLLSLSYFISLARAFPVPPSLLLASTALVRFPARQAPIGAAVSERAGRQESPKTPSQLVAAWKAAEPSCDRPKV